MDFKQPEKKTRNEERFHYENLKIVRTFTKNLIDEMTTLVKAVVLFGSNAKTQTAKKDSDLDLMIVLDNINTYVTPELREAYKVIVAKLLKEIGNNKVHLMTVNFSDYWDMARKGDPIMINVLRSGVVVFDTNIVEPMQYLLELGKIKPTRETVYNYQSRAETLLAETEKHIEEAVMDLYYAVVDIVHSTLIVNSIIPPSPKDMPEIFKNKFKGTKLSKYSKTIEKLYKVSKDLEHKKISKFNGELYDKLREETSELIEKLKEYNLKELKKKDIFEL